MKRYWNIYYTFATTCCLISAAAFLALPNLEGICIGGLAFVCMKVGFNLGDRLNRKRHHE